MYLPPLKASFSFGEDVAGQGIYRALRQGISRPFIKLAQQSFPACRRSYRSPPWCCTSTVTPEPRASLRIVRAEAAPRCPLRGLLFHVGRVSAQGLPLPLNRP